MLSQTVESYIALRRAVGFSYQSRATVLRSFVRFATERREALVRSDTVLAWSRLATSLEESSRRLKILARFARWAHAEDPCHEIPPGDVFGHHRRRPVPFIFTTEDIQRLVQEASHLGPEGSLRPFTLGALFALLVATGLRLSEALRLCLSDVTPEGLLVRETKFRKSRLVPLHPTAVAGLERYLMRRRRTGGEDAHVFVSHLGGKLSRYAVGDAFRAIVRRLGLRPAGSNGPTPRVHCLRHTFAVRALQACPHDRDTVGRHLLALSTYLGHATVADTYWYLEATPQLLTDISIACEAFLRGETR